MGWLAFALLLMGAVYLFIQYREFRRGMLYALGGLVALGVALGAYNWFEQIQREQKRKATLSLIKRDDIEISNATLSVGLSGRLQATITNKSWHFLKEITLELVVYDCAITPELFDKESKCGIVGQVKVTDYNINVPSGQKRALDKFVSFDNMPELKPKEWSWRYSVAELVAKID